MDGSEQAEARLSPSIQDATPLSAVFYHSPDLIAVINRQFVYTTVNPAFTRLRKKPVEEIVGHSVSEYLGKRVFQTLARPHLERAFSGETACYEAWLTYPDGPRFVSVHYYPIFSKDQSRGEQELGDQAGNVEQVVSLTRDLTESKRAEEALRESEEHYRLLFRDMQVGFALHEIITDARGKPVDYRFLEVNSAFEAQTGLRADDIIGKRVSKVMPGTPSLIQICGEVALTGKPARFDLYFPPLGRHFSVNAFSPNPNQFAVAFHDVSELVRARDTLKRYQLLSAHSRDIILFVRLADGRIVEANEAAVQAYGYSTDELLKLSIYDLRAPETVALTHIQLANANSRGVLFEAVHRRKDGSTFPVEVSSLGAEVGGERILLSIVRDISERRAAERHRQDSLELAAHEMSTPLATLRGYVQLLMKQGGHDDQERQAIAVLDRQTRRLVRLVQTLLDASRIQRGEWSLSLSRVDLCGLVQEAIEAFQDSRRVSIQLTFDCEGADIVEVDRVQVLEVIHCLLDNAVKYSLETCPIDVVVQRAGNEAIVTVQAHGPGISEEDQERLFEPCYQTEPMIWPTAGIGLGLYISREIVHRHGGRIRVESDLGKGAAFRFTLPLA